MSGEYGEESFFQKHYHFRRTDGRLVYPEDWYQGGETLLQQSPVVFEKNDRVCA